MDFADSDDEAQFRERLRSWLAEHDPPELPADPLAWAEARNDWHRRLHDAGFIGMGFPVAWGGQGRSPVYEAILNDELGRAGAPPPEAVGHLANALVIFGTDEQRRSLLPGLLSGRERWCQGFSEPGAGSDLAALTTSAERVERADGPVYLVSGRKIWTSLATGADWCFLLCRTDPGAPRHTGISVLLVPMGLPGIAVGPITTASRTEEFAEVAFDEVAVPAEHLLGAPGGGWEIATRLLAFERGPSDIGFLARLWRSYHLLERGIAAGDLVDAPGYRQRLAEVYIALRALEVQVQRSLSARLDGSLPGPEGSVDKLLLTRADQLLGHLLMDLRGAEPLLTEDDDWDTYLWSRASSIYGGTEQIQRTIVATKVLGMPRGH